MILPLADKPPIGPFAPRRVSMRGRYLIRNPRVALLFRLIDALLSLVPRCTRKSTASPKRILVANWAHLGDVITTIGALRALRTRFPTAHIGMIVGSWSRIAIAETDLVDSIHMVDHWNLNRAAIRGKAKRAHYRETRKAALREIRAIGYDVAIDLYPFFPPAHPLFFKAAIPVRIGFTSGGLGPLLTVPVRWSDEERPMADHYRDLIDHIDPAHRFEPEAMRPSRDRATLTPLPEEVAAAGRYVVIHPGAGSPTRHWGAERWQAVIARLRREAGDCRIVVTGAGAADEAIAGDLAAAFPDLINMAGRAGWEQFTRILADAALVVCPDTATGHVAALFRTPTVVIFTGTNSPAKWAPFNDRVRVLVRPVVCAPCNRAGCAEMACFREVDPDDVASAALATLAEGKSDLRR